MQDLGGKYGRWKREQYLKAQGRMTVFHDNKAKTTKSP
jgi:hypothetical protein